MIITSLFGTSVSAVLTSSMVAYYSWDNAGFGTDYYGSYNYANNGGTNMGTSASYTKCIRKLLDGEINIGDNNQYIPACWKHFFSE